MILSACHNDPTGHINSGVASPFGDWTMTTKTKKYPKIKFLRELRQRCRDDDLDAQRLCIGAADNLGCSADNERVNLPRWEQCYQELEMNLMEMANEMDDEDDAEQTLVDEINGCIGMCDNIKL